MNRKLVASTLILMGWAGQALADEAAPAPAPAPAAVEVKETPKAPEEWKANAGLSAIINTGNSSSQTVGGNALVSHKANRNKVEWTAGGAYGRARDNATGTSTTNTENWRTQLRYDRFLTDPISLFALGHIGADKPGLIDLRYGGAAGLSHEIYKVDPHFFKYEVGFDVTHEDRLPNPTTSANLYSARLFLNYKYKLSAWATFEEGLESLFNVKEGKDVRINSLTAVNMKLTDKLAFQAGYSLRFDNVPVPGAKKLDTMTTLGLVMNFI